MYSSKLFLQIQSEYSMGLEGCTKPNICCECQAKDNVIQKYQKLVLLYKKKLAKVYRNPINDSQKIKSSFLQTDDKQNKNQEKDLTKDLNLGLKANSLYSQTSESSFNHQNPSLHFSKVQKVMIKTSDSQHFCKKTGQKIELTQMQRENIEEMTQQMKKKERRINNLIDQIQKLKKQSLHFRGIVFQFLKNLEIKIPINQVITFSKADLPHNISLNSQATHILSLIIHFFQFSEHQRMQIFNFPQYQRDEKETKKIIMLKNKKLSSSMHGVTQIGNKHMYSTFKENINLST